jgi:hypothetical protein
VDRGHITLVGEVASRVDREVIGHIARGTLSFGVDNQLSVESEREKEPVKKTSQEG